MFKSLRISSIVLYTLLAIAILFAVLFYFGKVKQGTAGTPIQEPVITDKILILSYVFFGIALILGILFPIIELFRNPKNALVILIGLIVFLGIVGVSYLLASGNPIPGFENKSNVKHVLLFVDTGLKTAYIFSGLAVLGIIYTEIAGMLKK